MTSPEISPDSLGKLKKTLQPKKENVYAGYAIATILCIGGSYSIYIDPAQNYLLGALLLIGAIGMAWYVRRLSRLAVAIHELGFVVHRGLSQLVFPWDSIECVNEHHKAEGIPMARGVAGAVAKKIADKTTRSYTVVRDDGQEFYFDDNIVPRSSLLAGPLRTAQRNHGFKWNTYSS